MVLRIFCISLEPERSEACDAVRSGTDEEEVLGEEVAHEYQVVAVWDRLDESVPGEDEVGEDEEQGSESIEGAALEHAGYEHCGDDHGVDADSDADYACWGAWSNDCKCHRKKAGDTYQQHGEIAFCPGCELLIVLDLCKIAFYEEPYIEHMRNCE